LFARARCAAAFGHPRLQARNGRDLPLGLLNIQMQAILIDPVLIN
jgi:hypothetical protein